MVWDRNHKTNLFLIKWILPDTSVHNRRFLLKIIQNDWLNLLLNIIVMDFYFLLYLLSNHSSIVSISTLESESGTVWKLLEAIYIPSPSPTLQHPATHSLQLGCTLHYQPENKTEFTSAARHWCFSIDQRAHCSVMIPRPFLPPLPLSPLSTLILL